MMRWRDGGRRVGCSFIACNINFHRERLRKHCNLDRLYISTHKGALIQEFILNFSRDIFTAPTNISSLSALETFVFIC